jgi:hypothetical protein
MKAGYNIFMHISVFAGLLIGYAHFWDRMRPKKLRVLTWNRIIMFSIRCLYVIVVMVIAIVIPGFDIIMYEPIWIDFAYFRPKRNPKTTAMLYCLEYLKNPNRINVVYSRSISRSAWRQLLATSFILINPPPSPRALPPDTSYPPLDAGAFWGQSAQSPSTSSCPSLCT